MADRSVRPCALLYDPAFVALAEDSMRRYVSWDELVQRPLPNGVSAAQTWEILKTVRRFSALWFPLKDMSGGRYWYTLPAESMRWVAAIAHHCRTDSMLHQTVLHREGRRFLARSRTVEAVATCQLDGIVVPWEDAEILLQSRRSPRSATEQIVLNAYALMSELDEVATEPFSPRLIRDLYARVIDRVDVDALERTAPQYGLTGRTEQFSMSEEQAEDVLAQICAYANGETGESLEPVAVKGHILMNAMEFWNLLPDFNGIVGRSMLRLYALKNDHPVLGYLPVSRWYKLWLDGQLESQVRFSALPYMVSMEKEYDYTPDVITYLQLTVAAIDELRDFMQLTRRRDAEIRSSLEREAELNYRQRSILMRALSNPAQEFRIREHQNTHHVVYATARADLLELARLGYLQKEERGKAFVFVPTEGLRAMVAGEGSDEDA